MSNQALSVVGNVDLSIGAANQDPSSMDDAQITKILEAAPLLRQLLEGVEAEAQRRLENGASIPGLKLVNGRGTRSWSLDDEGMEAVLTKMGLPKSAIYESKLISPAKAEKVKWTKRDDTQMSLSKKQIELLEKEYVIKTVGKPTVALASDPRPAVQIAVAPMFPVIESTQQEDIPAWLK